MTTLWCFITYSVNQGTTVSIRYLGIEVEYAFEITQQTKVYSKQLIKL